MNPPGASAKLPGITPPLFTPGGRRLPPLGLSPGGHLNPDTPGTNLWNSLLSATNNNGTAGGANNTVNGVPAPETGQALPYPQNHSNYNQFVNNLRKTGLTPNESNLRSGLTPGGISQSSFSFGNGVPGLTTPSALLNSPMTPGLSSLLGMTQYSQPHQNIQNQQQSQLANQQGVQQDHQSQNQAPNLQAQNFKPLNQLPQQIHSVQQQQQQQVQQVQQVQQQQQQQQQVQQQQQPFQQQALPSHAHSQKPQVQPEQISQKPLILQWDHQQIHTIPEEPYVKLESDTGPSIADKNKLNGSPPESKKRKVTKTARKGKKDTKAEAKQIEEDLDESDDSTSPDGDKSSSGDKRKSALERNRVAASKCRQRKKLQLQKMEDELTFYSTGYRELSAQVQQLRDQLITFKGIIVGHKDCAMLAQSLGGYDAFNNIIQQANYVTQNTISSQSNVTSIPSTIPTTLNNTQAINQAPNVQTVYQIPPPAPTSGIAPALPMHLNNPASTDSQTTGGSTNSSTSMTHASLNFSASGLSNNAPIVSHSSMIDLPASLGHQAIGNPHATNKNHQISDGGSDLRAIHSMTNLAAQQQPQYNDLTGFNLRPVNSMVDLQLHQQ